MIRVNKGQFFLFDLILSIVIIIVSLSLIFNYYIYVEEDSDLYELNKNIINSFTNTKINDLNDDVVRDMFRKNYIKNIENTVAQQVIEFYFDANNPVLKKKLAKNLTRVFVEDYIDKQMNFNFTLSNSTDSSCSDCVFVLHTALNKKEVSFEDASVVSVNNRRIFGFEGTKVHGPYLFEVKI